MSSAAKAAVSAKTGPIGHRRVNILVMMFLICGFDFWEKTTLGLAVANTGFLHTFNLAPHAVVLGALTSIGLVGYGIGNLVWGFVVDRLGARTAGAANFFMGAIALIGIGLSPTLGSLMICQFIVGLSTGATFAIANQLSATWLPFGERGRAIGVAWMGVGLFPTLLVPIMALLMVSIGWRAAYWVLGLTLGIILVPIYFLVVRDAPEKDPRIQPAELQLIQGGRRLPAAGKATLKSDTSTTVGILKAGIFWLDVIYTVANGQVMWGMMGWAIVYLVTARHLSFAASGIYMALATALQVVVAFVLGWSTDRLGGRRAPAGIVLWVVAIIAIVVCFKVPAAAVALIGFIFMRSTAPNGPVIGQAILHSVIPPKSMGRGAGMQACINNVLAAISPIMVGALFSVHHDWTLPLVWLLLWSLIALGVMIRFQTLNL